MVENQILPETDVPVAPIEIPPTSTKPSTTRTRKKLIPTVEPLNAGVAASPYQESDFAEAAFGTETPETLDTKGLFAAAKTAATEAAVDAVIDGALLTGVSEFDKGRLIKALATAASVTKRELCMKWNDRAKRLPVIPPTAEHLAAETEALAAEKMAQAEALAAQRDGAWKKCEPLAKDPNLMMRMNDVVHRLGVVGEDRAILAVYLTASSRLNRRKAMSLLRRGSAASGKSFVVATVLKLIPPDQIITASGGSPKSLPYYGGAENDDSLAHKIIYIPEAAIIADHKGVEGEFTTMLRVLISENEIVYQTVTTREGQLPITVTILKRGPIACLLTSARANIEEELLTRLVVADSDETDAQTQAVIGHDLQDDDGEPSVTDDELAECQALQEYLQLGGPYIVVIPFLQALRQCLKTMPKPPLRFRRDLQAFRMAICTSAILHSAQRQRDARGRIIATLDDYSLAYDALNDGLATLYGTKIATTLHPIIVAIEGLVAKEQVHRAALQAKSQVSANSGSSQTQPLTLTMPTDSAPVSIRGLMSALQMSSRDTASSRLQQALTHELIEVVDLPSRSYSRVETKFYRVLVSSAMLQQVQGKAVFPSRALVERAQTRTQWPPPWVARDSSGWPE